ncbi:ABC transporter substrate-binding protein [Massilia oculi]|uniref:ABC transporter substrate-binding protein n=1 Tax=Massilia hydrophila TaxID=3044279 RepID=A0ABS7YB01_9BURK|nr:ABC transporter substrate-binding protein [Massilia oculi]MCA1856870.1 ABC transporter substrate-binding protein [Massilia oculi]
MLIPSVAIAVAAFGGMAGTALGAVADSKPRLYITTETSAPSSMLDGKWVIGIATDKVREAMQRAGVDYTIELLPWKRAFLAAQQRPDACVYSTSRTPERESQFKWVGPTDVGQWVLMARADREFKLNSLEDARGLRIGTYNGDARDAYLRARGFHVDAANEDLANAGKLLLDRIDLWAASLRSGSTILKRYGYDKKIVQVLVFNRVELYLACNRAVPDVLVQRLNTAFDAIARDGTGRRIERSYETWGKPLRQP